MSIENTLVLAHSKLVEFEQAPLLKNCGLIANEPDVVFVDSWDTAASKAQSVDWENFGISGRNEFMNKLRVNAEERTYTWNEAVADLKPSVEEFVARLLVGQPLLRLMSKISFDILNWDFLHLCLYSANSDVARVRFYEEMSKWYLKGHFPCGWEEDLDSGVLQVY